MYTSILGNSAASLMAAFKALPCLMDSSTSINLFSARRLPTTLPAMRSDCVSETPVLVSVARVRLNRAASMRVTAFLNSGARSLKES